MNCIQTQELLGPYLDSELDARTVQEIRAHLVECDECANLYQAEERFNRVVSTALGRETKDGAFWAHEEAFITRSSAPGRQSAMPPLRARVVASPWVELLWPTPKYYLALAAIWLALLVGNWSSSVPFTQRAVQQPLRAAASRLDLAEQHRQLRELLGLVEPNTPASSVNLHLPRVL